MFPRFYTFLNFTPYLGGPPQKCKIEVLVHLFRLVLSDISLILCSCKVMYVSRKCLLHVHACTLARTHVYACFLIYFIHWKDIMVL